MKDGEIWAIEFRGTTGRWDVIQTASTRKIARESLKYHYKAINPKIKYRVVKYVRQEAK